VEPVDAPMLTTMFGPLGAGVGVGLGEAGDGLAYDEPPQPHISNAPATATADPQIDRENSEDPMLSPPE
jgi:hypothetical protein